MCQWFEHINVGGFFLLKMIWLNSADLLTLYFASLSSQRFNKRFERCSQGDSRAELLVGGRLSSFSNSFFFFLHTLWLVFQGIWFILELNNDRNLWKDQHSSLGGRGGIEGQNSNSIFTVHFISVNAHCGSWIFASLSAPPRTARLLLFEKWELFGICKGEKCLYVSESGGYNRWYIASNIQEEIESERNPPTTLICSLHCQKPCSIDSYRFGNLRAKRGQTGRKMKTKKVKGGWDRDISEAVAEYSSLLAEGLAGCWCSRKNWQSLASLSWNQGAVRLLLKLFKRKSTFSWAVNFW